jgi:RNA polymerase sigma-70 factor, ECF subfamily
MDEFVNVEDGELVRGARSGDSPSFAELVRRYSRPAYSVALSVTGRHEDAEDVAQEAFLVALERLEECRDPDRFLGWFLAIVRNRSRNLIRREGVRRSEPLYLGLPTREPGPEAVTERSTLRSRLEEAMAVLSEIQREVLLLHDLEGWKHREIAERLAVPAGTIRSHLHHARKRMRKELDAMPSGGEEMRTG